MSFLTLCPAIGVLEAEGIQSKGVAWTAELWAHAQGPSPAVMAGNPAHVPVNADAEVRISLVAGDVWYTAFFPVLLTDKKGS